jgi:hypothetical protein
VSVITHPGVAGLPFGARPVPEGGLLSRVHRPCCEHGSDAVCVGRDESEGCLVFWCDRGAHHFSTR